MHTSKTKGFAVPVSIYYQMGLFGIVEAAVLLEKTIIESFLRLFKLELFKLLVILSDCDERYNNIMHLIISQPNPIHSTQETLRKLITKSTYYNLITSVNVARTSYQTSMRLYPYYWKIKIRL